jgi:hypothetical protein
MFKSFWAYMFEKYRVRRALNRLTVLAKDTDEIANRLSEMNIKGIIGSGQKCPIANYVRKETGINVNAGTQYVGPVRLRTDYDDKLEPDLLIEDFIVNFDRGKYLQLVSADEST